MNAIQFIKDHGVEKARELLARLHKLGCPDDMQITVINGMWHRTTNGFTYPDLKRLVESVDLVKSYGGVINAQHEIKYLDLDWDYDSPRVVRLKQAIADYESIYGGEHV
jgi:FAD/FMN-containing dehydrogenase